MILSANLQQELDSRDSFDVFVRTYAPVSISSELGQLLDSLGVRGINGKRTILTGTLDKSGICALMSNPDIELLSLSLPLYCDFVEEE